MYTRIKPWMRKPEFGKWGMILRDSRWIMLNNGASAMTNVGDYAVIAFILSADQRGVYLFAYQLVVQSALLLAANVTQVMFPTLSALKDDPVRFRAAMLRTLRALMLVTAPATVGTGVVMAPVEDLIFGGKWDDAVWVVIVCAVLFPPRAIVPLSLSSLMARAMFRQNSVITIVVGSAMMVGAAIGGVIAVGFDAAWSGRLLGVAGLSGGTFAGEVAREMMFSAISTGAIGATLGCGVLRAVASMWGILWAAKLAGVRRRDTLDAILGSWMLSIVAMVPALALDLFVINDAHPLLRFFVAAGVYSLVWLGLTRLLLERDLRDLLTAVPTRLRRLGLRVLLMKEQA
jgi:O-antigen/teichoic acid export membrane protein